MTIEITSSMSTFDWYAVIFIMSFVVGLYAGAWIERMKQ